MKRDMEVVRRVLLKIEEDYVSTALWNLQLEDIDMETVAYHCKLLHDAGFVTSYNARYSDNRLWMFGVGGLTWEGHEFLDRIRDESQWKKTKATIKKHGLPLVIETVKSVSAALVTAATEGAVLAIIKSNDVC